MNNTTYMPCPRCHTLQRTKKNMQGVRTLTVHQHPGQRNCIGGGHTPDSEEFTGIMDTLRRFYWRLTR